jgi:putative restriction endonuclease
MKLFVGLTDHDWYRHLRKLAPDEVNFWFPSPRIGFGALEPGEPFLFKAKAPHHAIIGGGFFVRYVRVSVSLAWQAFGERNGASDAITLFERIRRYRSQEVSPDPEIGCVLLNEPFFFPEELWIPAPADWSREIVRGKTYSTEEAIGADLWNEVVARLADPRAITGPMASVPGQGTTAPAYGAEYLTRGRLGQGTFRLAVLDAYQTRCAVTGERVRPVLEAAHIRPFAKQGPNAVSNGLALRADIHRLFDLGYVTVDPQLRFRVSQRLRTEFNNGVDYYRFDGKGLRVLPDRLHERPAREYLEWHSDVVFRP